MAIADCEKCGGTGWIIVQKAELSGAARCECTQVGRTERVEQRANIPSQYSGASFDNFEIPDNNPTAMRGLSDAHRIVSGYAREFPITDKPGLLLIGEPGTGKTHLAVAALRKIMSKGFEGIFYDYQSLLQSIRSGYQADAGFSDREAYRTALEAEVLMLDDLGAHRVTDWVEDTVTSIITHRCNHRKPLIATTNLPDNDAGGVRFDRNAALPGRVEYRVSLSERVGHRARSRLFEMCRIVVMPQVEDYRIRRRRA